MKSRSRVSRVLALASAVGAVATLFFSQPAMADGAVVIETRFPYASLRAEAVTEVSRDTVRLTLTAEESGTAQPAVAAALAEKVDSVMKQVKGHADIEVSSGNFQIWPMSNREGQIASWRGTAAILLESTDFEAVSQLAAKVADRMPIGNISFFVAPEARARYEAALMQEAADAFQARAQALTDAFGYASYEIREIQLGGEGASYQPEGRRMMAMAASADAAPPVPLE
ncbi:MAG: SIMPL domain-containing protein, partial [Trueperaceae bacterium]